MPTDRHWGQSPLEAPHMRPRLLPRARWGKAALALILLVTLCRSLAYASSQPALLAPDEDYHWNYVEYLVTQHTVPSLSGPFATGEVYSTALLTDQGQYLSGPRTRYRGRPHAVVARLNGLPGSQQMPTGEPPRQVLHPPGWHIGAAIVDREMGSRSPVTRMTAMRYYSAVLGAIGVFFAWLLAAQVLARLWQQLAAAALVACQPMVAFSASTLTNDVLVLATFTAALAWCAFLLRSRPRPSQGIGLGILIAAAVLSKSTALALIPIALLTLALVWRSHRGSGRAVLGIAAWTGGLPLVLAGAWYAYVYDHTGSILGGKANLGGSGAPTRGAGAVAHHGITYVPEAIYDWLRVVYPGYWFEYLGYEIRDHDVWYYLPLAIGAIGILGLIVFIARTWRSLFDPGRAQLRQAAVLIVAPLILLGPLLYVDVTRELKGLGYAEAQGRFLTPTYPAVAVLMLLGLRELTRFAKRGFAIATGALTILAAVFYAHTYVRWNLERFYGAIDGNPIRLLRHVGWDKPEWVGPTWFIALFAIMVLGSLAAFAITVAKSRRQPADRNVEREPEAEERAPPASSPAVA